MTPEQAKRPNAVCMKGTLFFPPFRANEEIKVTVDESYNADTKTMPCRINVNINDDVSPGQSLTASLYLQDSLYRVGPQLSVADKGDKRFVAIMPRRNPNC